MDEIAALLDRMRSLERETYVFGGASAEAIRELESLFGQAMPPSYRAFLARFGSVSVLNTVFSGILKGRVDGGMGCAWTDTKRDRKRWKLEPHYLVVQPDEDGPTCLDFSRKSADGEHPVVFQMPFRPSSDLSDSYGKWLGENLNAMVKAWEDKD